MKIKKLSISFKLSLKDKELRLLIDYERKVVLFSISPDSLTSDEWNEISQFLTRHKASSFNYE